MATGRLTDIIKARRESGEGIASSLVGGSKERLKEKFDIRRALPQGGLLTALFPKLRAYKSILPTEQSSSGVSGALNQPTQSTDGLSVTNSLFQSININTKIIAKNSMVLPLIQKDTNLMGQTLKKIVKAMQVRKKFVPVTRTRPTRVRRIGVAYIVKGGETEREEPEKEKSFFESLIGILTGSLLSIGSLITKTLTGLSEKIITGIVDGFKGLFTATKIASSVLLSILRPLLGLIFSPVGFALILAAGIFFSLYKLSKALSKTIAEEVPNMNVLSPQQAADVLKERSKTVIEMASKSAGQKTPFTLEEAVAYLENQVENGKKIAEEGSNLIQEKNRLESILKSGNESKIESEGGAAAIEGKISNLKIRIQNLGGEKKIKEIISEGPAQLPLLENRAYSTERYGDNRTGTKAYEDRKSAKTRRKDQEILGNLESEDAATGRIIRIDRAIADREKSEREGYGRQDPTSPLKDPFKSPNIAPPTSSGDISPALTNSAVDAQDGPGITGTMAKPTIPTPDASYDKNDDLDIIIKNIMEAQNPMNYAQDGPGTDSVDAAKAIRLGSTLNADHPDIISYHNAMTLQISRTG